MSSNTDRPYYFGLFMSPAALPGRYYYIFRENDKNTTPQSFVYSGPIPKLQFQYILVLAQLCLWIDYIASAFRVKTVNF